MNNLTCAEICRSIREKAGTGKGDQENCVRRQNERKPD